MNNYNSFMEWLLSLCGDELPEIAGFLFFIMAGWLVVKRRQIRAGTICFVLSAAIAFGTTVYAYWRRYNG